jgi:two-component system, chemotaxis family, sensor kinase CheA
VDRDRYAKLFLSESRENLSEISNALLDLERGGSDAAVARLFRGVHTLKGMGAAMGYTSVADLSHELETLLDKVRSGALVVGRSTIDTLFAAVDSLEKAIDLATSTPSQNLEIAEIVERIRLAAVQERSQTFTSEFAVVNGNKKEPEAPAPAASTQKAPRQIRVDSKRLDTLMNVVGELVIARDRIAKVAERIADDELNEAILRASQILANLQNEIMTSRMVPVWQVFERFPRVVRDTARSLGKEVEFKIEGRDIELDRSMLDEMGEPVLHLLRNALDHGVETPTEREKAGKPRVARQC